LDGRDAAQGKKPKTIELKDMDKKVEALKTQHESEMNKVKSMGRHLVNEYFKQKSEENST